MTTLEAHAYFMSIPLDTREELFAFDSNLQDVWPAVGTAMASLSGQLEECDTTEDLLGALEHFRIVSEAGGVTDEQLASEAETVIAEVLAWGERYEAGREARLRNRGRGPGRRNLGS